MIQRGNTDRKRCSGDCPDIKRTTGMDQIPSGITTGCSVVLIDLPQVILSGIEYHIAIMRRTRASSGTEGKSAYRCWCRTSHIITGAGGTWNKRNIAYFLRSE